MITGTAEGEDGGGSNLYCRTSASLLLKTLMVIVLLLFADEDGESARAAEVELVAGGGDEDGDAATPGFPVSAMALRIVRLAKAASISLWKGSTRS